MKPSARDTPGDEEDMSAVKADMERGMIERAEVELRRMPCPDCPDGQLWDKNGPTSDACLTCGGEAFIWTGAPEDAGITADDGEIAPDGKDVTEILT